jgi:hypothetical protein
MRVIATVFKKYEVNKWSRRQYGGNHAIMFLSRIEVALERGQMYSISSLDIGQFVDNDNDMEKRLENYSDKDKPMPENSKDIVYEDGVASIEVYMTL